MRLLLSILLVLAVLLPVHADARIKVAMYGPQGTIWTGHNYDYLTRTKADGTPLVDRLYLATTNRSTLDRLKAELPHLELICVSDLSFCRAKVSNGFWTGWPDGLDDPARLDVSPDLAMAKVYRENYSGGWDHFWADSRGRWISPDYGNIVASPTARFVRGEFSGKKPLPVWGEMFRRVIHDRHYYDGIMLDMTAGRLTWEPWDDYLDDRQWYDEFQAFGNQMTLMGVPVFGNAWGCGPRDYGNWPGYKLESWGNKSGPSGSYEGFGYIAAFELSLKFRGDFEPTKWTTGLSTLTPAQRANTLLCIQPHPGTSEPGKFQLLMAGLATCHLMGVQYASFHDHSRMEDWWDPHSQYAYEIERMLRLEPVHPTVWRRWSDRTYLAYNIPDARTCVALGDVYGSRLMVDPQGGQLWEVRYNPHDHQVGYMRARTAYLVAKSTRSIF